MRVGVLLLAFGRTRSGPALRQAGLAAILMAAVGCSPTSQEPPRPYGITPAIPLGVAATLDHRLANDLDLVKQATAPPTARESAAIGHSIEYRDEVAGRRTGRQESVVILLDTAGQIRGVGGSFSTKGGSEPVRKFLLSYWAAVSGEFPEFTAPIEGTIASFYSAKIEGQWTRSATMEQVLINLR